ncbi:MAG: LAGLIDADG family homing endonuclease, partial [candidate division WOR-3 bacterium]
MGGANQQERLSTAEAKRWFLAGFIEGEGCLCVSIKHHPGSRFGFIVDPEFFLYQHKSGIKLLELAKEIFGSGRITPKPGNEEVLVYSIVSRRTLKEKVIPFFEKYMIFSAKRDVFLRFKEIVEAMEDRKEHLTPEGLVRIVEKAYAMNPAGKGKERKRTLQKVVDRILRGHTPDTPVAQE